MKWPAASSGRLAGETYTFTIAGDALARLRTETVAQARHTVERRVNELGVSEPMIAVQGAANDEILVQLPGIGDMDRARGILGATALLEWKLVERGPAPTREALLASTGGVIPPHTEVVTGPADRTTHDAPSYYLVQTVGGDHRPRSAQRPTDAGREQSAGSGIFVDPGWRPTIRAGDEAKTSVAPSRSSWTAAAVGTAD